MQAHNRRLTARLLAGAAVAVLLVSACSSKSKTSSGGTASGASASAPASSAMGSGGAGSTSGAATVKTTTGKLGTFLTDGKGRTLYVFAADTTTQSTCYGSCASYWPPMLTTGTPTAGSGVDTAKLGTTKRNDGKTQVTYNGHPLYTFLLDKAAGDTNGQGKNLNGGLWWVVAPDGKAIMGSSGSQAPSSSSGGGGGGGGGY